LPRHGIRKAKQEHAIGGDQQHQIDRERQGGQIHDARGLPLRKSVGLVAGITAQKPRHVDRGIQCDAGLQRDDDEPDEQRGAGGHRQAVALPGARPPRPSLSPWPRAHRVVLPQARALSPDHDSPGAIVVRGSRGLRP